MTDSDIPDFGLTVRQVEDEDGNVIFTVHDKGGLAESTRSFEALSPMARITWAKQQGWPHDKVVEAGRADGLLYQGIDLDDQQP
jgi:hypothetical protein